MPLHVALDATPLLGPRTGVGRYVGELVGALARLPSAEPPELTLTPFTVRGAGSLRGQAPPGVRVRHRPAPARVLQWSWQRLRLPPVEVLTGRCDVFHATNFVLPPTLRAASVVTVHDLAFTRHPGTVTAAVRRYSELVPLSLRRAALVLCPAEATADDVAEHYGLDRARVRATPLGVGPQWRCVEPLDDGARRALGLPERYLLFVGTREPRKHLPVLLAAHTAARGVERDVPPLVLAGPAGWGDQPLPGDGIVCTGWLDDDRLRSLVAGAAALVLPSVYEGFGLPLLEALACGRPVVASDLPVHREVTGGHARLFPAGDVDALTAELLSVVADPDDATARAVRRAWADRWTWQGCAEATARAYRDAAA